VPGPLPAARGVNRTAADPLEILVLCDVPLPLPVSETIPAAALRPSLPEEMLAEGRLVFQNPHHAARAYPGMWPTERAAAKAFERARSATFPYIGFILGRCRTPLVPVIYQVSGAGQKLAHAWFHPLMADCEAWLTERLGRLVRRHAHRPSGARRMGGLAIRSRDGKRPVSSRRRSLARARASCARTAKNLGPARAGCGGPTL
jgi:hypothetical protein